MSGAKEFKHLKHKNGDKNLHYYIYYNKSNHNLRT